MINFCRHQRIADHKGFHTSNTSIFPRRSFEQVRLWGYWRMLATTTNKFSIERHKSSMYVLQHAGRAPSTDVGVDSRDRRPGTSRRFYTLCLLLCRWCSLRSTIYGSLTVEPALLAPFASHGYTSMLDQINQHMTSSVAYSRHDFRP